MGLSDSYIIAPASVVEEVVANPPRFERAFCAEWRARPDAWFTAEKAFEAIAYCLAEGTAYRDRRLLRLYAEPVTLPEQLTRVAWPRVFRPAEVRSLAAALSAVTDRDLLIAYDAARMNALNVGPTTWGEDPAWDRNYIWGNFQTLAAGFANAADSGSGVLALLT